MDQPYVYAALNEYLREIRLLEAEPASTLDSKETVRCHIIHVSLLDAPYYETTSYCWDDPTRRAMIMVDGLPLDVPASAERVLRRLRYHDGRKRTLWMDAASINQNDLAERASQVSMMDRVYTNTRQNLIWLGDDAGDAQAAIEDLKKIVKRLERKFDATSPASVHQRVREIEFCTSNDLPEIESSDIDFAAILREVYSRPFFSRLWVQQEVAPSYHSLCHLGLFELSLNNVLTVATYMCSQPSVAMFESVKSYYPIMFMSKFTYLRPASQQTQIRVLPKAGDLFHTACTLRYSDERDKVCALLGIFRTWYKNIAAHENLLRPDYTRPVLDVVSDATKAIILSDRGAGVLDVLHLAGYADNEELIDTRPSWVPRPHLPASTHGSPELYAAALCDFDADCGTNIIRPNQYPLAFQGKTLLASGLLIGPVVAVSATFSKESLEDKGWLAEQLHKFALAAFKRRSESLQGTMAATGCSLFGLGYEKPRAKEWAVRKAFRPDEVAATKDAAYAAKYGYHDHVAVNAAERKLFYTQSGQVGLGPKVLGSGDVVAILFRSNFPVALRPEGGRYRFLGVCYVYKYMYGELLVEWEKQGSLKERIERFGIV